MSESEMVERATLALKTYWIEHGYDPSNPDEGAARAVIESLREPSESEMVRRGARALCWVHRKNRWPQCGCDPVCRELNGAVAEPEARAVIEAMREPTEAVMYALANDGWDAAIAEALK